MGSRDYYHDFSDNEVIMQSRIYYLVIMHGLDRACGKEDACIGSVFAVTFGDLE